MVRVHVRPLESSESDFGAFLFLASRNVSTLFPTRDFRRLFGFLSSRDFRRLARFKKLNVFPRRSSFAFEVPPTEIAFQFYLRSPLG